MLAYGFQIHIYTYLYILPDVHILMYATAALFYMHTPYAYIQYIQNTSTTYASLTSTYTTTYISTSTALHPSLVPFVFMTTPIPISSLSIYMAATVPIRTHTAIHTYYHADI